MAANETGGGILGWLDERLGLTRFHAKYLRKAFPVHHSFFLGEITVFAFVTLVLTGIFLSLNYEPSIQERDGGPAAYQSILYINSLPFGRMIRRIHHWSANLMIAAAFLHMFRIYFTGAFKKPREINWFIGGTLLAVTTITAVTGYALPFDSYAVTATKVSQGILESVPWIGGWLGRAAFAGDFPAAGSLQRIYAYHVIWLPLVIGLLIGAHLLVMFKQKHTMPPAAAKKVRGKVLGVPMVPQQAILMLTLLLGYVGVVAIFSAFVPAHPVEVYGPPVVGTPPVKPDWYLLWMFGLLSMIPSAWNFEFLGARFTPEFFGGILLPGLIVFSLAAVPFIDRSRTRRLYAEIPTHFPVRLAAGVSFLALIGVFSLAGYRVELDLAVSLLWILALVVPAVAGLIAYALLTGWPWRRPRGHAVPEPD